jgi:hypothetical protein
MSDDASLDDNPPMFPPGCLGALIAAASSAPKPAVQISR